MPDYLAPFALVAIAGESIAFLTPGTIVASDLFASTMLLVAIFGILCSPLLEAHPWTAIIPLELGVAAVALLLDSEGGTSTGSGQLLVVPLVVAALFATRWMSGVTSASVVLTVVLLTGPADAATTVRRVITWCIVSLLVAVPIHMLRRKLATTASTQERQRIARELHDGLAQELAYLASRARQLDRDVPSQQVRELVDTADRALDEARRAVTVLTSTNRAEFSRSLREAADDARTRYGVPIELSISPGVEVNGDDGEQLLRIAREAVTNAAKHAQASSIRIRAWDGGAPELLIEDDGVGFDVDGTHRGYGLTSMRERAASIGAALTIQSSPLGGTRLRVLLP